MSADLKADLLARIVTGTVFHNEKETDALRARLQSATITEPPVSKDGKNPKWPRAVVNNALDLLEIRALNAGDVALAQHARQVLEEMPDPESQPPPPDPCVVECDGMSTTRRAVNASHRIRDDLYIRDDEGDTIGVTRSQAAALIPALQAFVREGGA